jgi:hypothetical protein
VGPAALSRNDPLGVIEPIVRIGEVPLEPIMIGLEASEALRQLSVGPALDSLGHGFPQSRERKPDETGEEEQDHRNEDSERVTIHGA